MGILKSLKRWFCNIGDYSETPVIYRHDKLTREALKRLSDKRKKDLESLPELVASLSPGDITSNINYLYIQEIGKYLSPIGSDRPHVVTMKHANGMYSEPIAKIECTNVLYSEWLVACCETKWKTKCKVAHDIHGNTYFLGNMIDTDYEIIYINDK